MLFGTKTVINAFKKFSCDTKYNDLYKLYPVYKIDVKKEQEKLVNTNVIVFQFPMY